MKVLDTIQVASFVVTGAAVLGAEYLGVRWLYNLAAIAFGLAVIIGGMRVMITGRARGAAVGMDRWHRDTRHTENHSGIRARLIGVLLLLGGSVMIALSAIETATTAGMESFWAQALRSPRSWGAVSAIAGLLMLIAGLMRAKAGTGSEAGSRAGVVEAEFKVRGVVTALAGLALLAVGAVLLVSPDILEGALDRLL